MPTIHRMTSIILFVLQAWLQNLRVQSMTQQRSAAVMRVQPTMQPDEAHRNVAPRPRNNEFKQRGEMLKGDFYLKLKLSQHRHPSQHVRGVSVLGQTDRFVGELEERIWKYVPSLPPNPKSGYKQNRLRYNCFGRMLPWSSFAHPHFLNYMFNSRIWELFHSFQNQIERFHSREGRLA